MTHASMAHGRGNWQGISLTLKIAVSVYWALMLAGVVVTVAILRDAEQEIATDYRRRSDLFVHHFASFAEAQTGDTELGARASTLASELAIPFVQILGKDGGIDVGAPTPGAWVEKRTAVAHRVQDDDSYEIAFHYPALSRAVQAKRKAIIAGMSAGFFAFGLFLTWLLRYLLTGPFDDMIATAGTISAGDTARRFAVNRRDEFGYLAQFINEVMEKLMQQRRLSRRSSPHGRRKLKFERTETNDIEPARICFEITESVAIAKIENVKQLIAELKRRGFRFALDDFGRGFSSFTYLQELPVDFIKIDGSFVQCMDTIPARRATVEAINQIGHAMNLKTVAEFVETAAVLATLREIGVDYAQGFGIAKPAPLYERVPALRQRQA